MAAPKISIITPVFEREFEIMRCYSSVSIQKGVDFEWVVVDDGSQDNTLGVLRSLAKNDNRIILRSNEGNGAQDARWTGVKNSRAEWLIFLDSDDELLPNCLLNRLKDVSIGQRKLYNSYCQYQDGSATKLWRSSHNHLGFFDSILALAPIVNISGVVWNRSELTKDVFSPTAMWQDLSFHFELISKMNVSVFTNGPVDIIIHMNTPNSISHGMMSFAKLKAKWDFATYLLDQTTRIDRKKVLQSPLFANAWNAALKADRYLVVRSFLKSPLFLNVYLFLKVIILCCPKKFALSFGKLNAPDQPYAIASELAEIHS